MLLTLLIAGWATVFVLALAQRSPATTAFAVVLSGVLTPLIMMLAFHMLWRPVMAPYPKQPVGLDAFSRSFQSFSVGMVNMGLCIRATVDDDHLHLEPWPIMQLLGASRASIPWSALVPARHPFAGGAFRAARLDGHLVIGPAWCLERAGGAEAA